MGRGTGERRRDGRTEKRWKKKEGQGAETEEKMTANERRGRERESKRRVL